MTTTLLQLRNFCKQRADMSGSTTADQLVPDDEWNFYINSSIAEFHDTVVRSNVRYYLTSSQFTVAPGGNSSPLPADFMALDGVERSYDGSGAPSTWYDVPMFPWRERNWGNNSYVSLLMLPWVRYNFANNNIVFTPALSAAGLYQMWYYPTAPKLVNDSDTFDDQRYWFEYVVVDCAIKALQKEESDVSVLMAQKQALKERIELMSSDRDYNTPEQFGARGGNGGSWNGPGGWGWGNFW